MSDSGKITRKDVEEAVNRYAPNLPTDERDAFVEWNAKSWEGEEWDSAGSWSLANEWVRFQNANRDNNGKSEGHWYTR